MKIETLPLENHQIKAIVEIDPERLEDAKHQAARKLARRTKIPGFRPGKAPYQIVVRHIGEEIILEEAIDILINDVYPEVIKQEDIKPFGPGTLEKIVSFDPPKFEFVIPLEAEVVLGEYRQLRQPYEPVEVTDDQVEAVLENLQEHQAILSPVERPIEVGDQAQVKLLGEYYDDSAESRNPLIPERSVPIIILAPEGNNDEEWPYPGFSHQLVGLSAGDEATFEYTFPDTYEDDNLRGKTGYYFTTVEAVKSRSLPEIDDEFAKTIGDYQTLEELRTAIKEDLENRQTSEYNREYDDRILEQAVEQSKIDYPPQMLERELNNIIERLKNDLERQRLDMDLYLKTREITMDELREEFTPTAIERIKKSLTLLEISKAENIKVNPDNLETATNRAINELAYVLPEEELRKILRNEEARSDLIGNVMMDLIIDQSQERLRTIGRGLADEPSDQPVESAAETQLESEIDESETAKVILSNENVPTLETSDEAVTEPVNDDSSADVTNPETSVLPDDSEQKQE